VAGLDPQRSPRLRCSAEERTRSAIGTGGATDGHCGAAGAKCPYRVGVLARSAFFGDAGSAGGYGRGALDARHRRAHNRTCTDSVSIAQSACAGCDIA
jgi:hypothetical protein